MASRGFENFTPADVARRALRQAGATRESKHSKYHAQRTEVDGLIFDSAKEARRYQELRLLALAGEITGLVCQPLYELHAPNGDVIGCFVPDFRYTERSGRVVVEDVKGMATLPLAKWKQKHLRLEYGVAVVEIR